MPGKQEPQRQGSQRDTQNTDKDRDRSNLGEQIPDQSRSGQSSERGSQPNIPNREGTEKSGGSQTERDTSTQRNNPERGSQRS